RARQGAGGDGEAGESVEQRDLAWEHAAVERDAGEVDGDDAVAGGVAGDPGEVAVTITMARWGRWRRRRDVPVGERGAVAGAAGEQGGLELGQRVQVSLRRGRRGSRGDGRHGEEWQ